MSRSRWIVVLFVLLASTGGCGSDGAGTEHVHDCEAAEAGCDAVDAEDRETDLVATDVILDTGEDDTFDAAGEDDIGAFDAGDVEEDVEPDVDDIGDAVDDTMTDTMMPPEPEPFTIRFATYNVRTSDLNNSAWGDTHVGWDANDAARMRRVADTIADQRLTVVAAQEVQKPERGAILTRLANAHGQSWGHSTYKNGRGESVVLFDKAVWKLVRETHYLIPVRNNRQRYAVGALLEHKETGRRVWFYSVHLSAGSGDGATARRTGTQKTLTSIENHPVAQGLPFVLGGDFNSGRNDAPANMLRSSGLMKSTRAVAEKLVNNGCQTLNKDAGSAGKQSCPGGVARHIDHVWVSKAGMKVRRYQVTANAHTSRSSDHNPVTTILDAL